MSSRWNNPGPGFAGAYQVSGIPYVTSSNHGELSATSANVVQISFPRVTRWFEIACSGSTDANSHLRLGFSENGVKGVGAVTSSVYTGVINEFGTEVWDTTSPRPTAAQLENTHKNFFVVGASTGVGATSRFEMACTDLFLRADGAGDTGFTIIAGLTSIARTTLNLTGSTGFHGVG